MLSKSSPAWRGVPSAAYRISSRRQLAPSGHNKGKQRKLVALCAASNAVDGLPVHLLANGLRIRHTSTPSEVEFLYNEHYKQKVYLQHQVSIVPGAVVVDVGANIGLLSMFAAEAAGPNGLVVSLEPAPLTAAALTSNMQQHARWCAEQGSQVAPCVVLQAAVGDGSQQEAQLTIYKGASGWSTLDRDDDELLDNMQLYLQHLLAGKSRTASSSSSSSSKAAGSMQHLHTAVGSGHNAQGLSRTQQLLMSCARWLYRAELLRPLSQMMSRLYVQQVMMGQVDSITCRVVTVSQIIEQQGIKCVDLLKVDVERAELQVLWGITQHHWPLIQQVAMEVHDTDGRLEEVVQLLKQQGGFTTVVFDQDPHLSGSSLYNLYAVREQQPDPRSTDAAAALMAPAAAQ